MEIINEIIEIDNNSETIYKYLTEDTLLFDIECTGLSSKTNFVYLIGCANRKDNQIIYTQFFADGYEDEKELLTSFNSYIKDFKKIMGYNSTRFDEPFLIDRFKKYAIESSINSMEHKDLYLTTTKTKVLLNLENYKQKTIEAFLDLNREDKYNGGELIPVYEKYADTKDVECKKLVLLHNLEDVKGMVHILDILRYADLLSYTPCDFQFENEADHFNIIVKTDISIPKSISKVREYGSYIINGNTAVISLKKYKGELKTFLSDYKNYYYIISEGIIIPKVLGASIDSSNRRNATKQDCAVSQNADYIMAPTGIKFNNNVRIFKASFEDKEQFIEEKNINYENARLIFKFMLKH